MAPKRRPFHSVQVPGTVPGTVLSEAARIVSVRYVILKGESPLVCPLVRRTLQCSLEVKGTYLCTPTRSYLVGYPLRVLHLLQLVLRRTLGEYQF